MIQIEIIRNCLLNDAFKYSLHALEEMRFEELGRIYDEDIESAIVNEEIIRQYPEDRPYPSVLIAGFTGDPANAVHVVCAYNQKDEIVLVVTAYRPDPAIWIDYKTRRE